MDGPADQVQDTIETYPELQPTIQTLLEQQRIAGTWVFEDADIDSGAFGELVSQEFVEEHAGEYRFIYPELIESVINEDNKEIPQSEVVERNLIARIDWTAVGMVGAALLFVGLVRVGFTHRSTFRADHIMLAGNDAYFYRFWAEQLLNSQTAEFSLQGLHRDALPGNVAVHDTLMIVFGWWFAAVLGGTSRAAGMALAVYPPLFGVLTAAITYKISTSTFNDKLAGVAGVGILAVTPAHAFRTALGFGDHHAFDFLLVGVTAIGLIRILVSTERAKSSQWESFSAVGLFASGVTGLALVWRGGPLFILPVAVVVFLRTLWNVRANRSPLRTDSLLFAGLVTAAGATLIIHLSLGWVEPFRGFAPSLLLGGAVLVGIVGEVVSRANGSARTALIVDLAAVVPGGALAWAFVPDVPRATKQFIAYMTTVAGSGIAETQSLIGGGLTFIRPIFLFGLFLFLALPYLGWATYQLWRENYPVSLVITVFGWYFLLLAVVQLRFAGSLSLFIAVFAGLGFKHLFAVVGYGSRPTPFRTEDDSSRVDQLADLELSVPPRRELLSIGLLVLLVSGLSIVQTPIKMEQVDVDDSTYEAAVAIEDHYTTTADPPTRYVLSFWPDNRLYNFVLGGDYRYYDFARTNYPTFLADTRPGNWTGDQVGYVVIRKTDAGFGDRMMYSRLFERSGSRGDGVAGVGTFRLIHVGDGGDVKVFAHTGGYELSGTATPNETVEIQKEVTVNGESFTYKREIKVNPSGTYSLRVSYSGTYRVDNRTVSVG